MSFWVNVPDLEGEHVSVGPYRTEAAADAMLDAAFVAGSREDGFAAVASAPTGQQMTEGGFKAFFRADFTVAPS